MRTKLLFLCVVLFALATLVVGAPAQAQTSGYKLTVLHTNDNHGRWEPVVVSNVSQGGIARRVTLVKKLRAENPNTLLLDAGDISQGTLYYVQHRGQEGRDFYNLVGYDVITPGNHEFDLGVKTLVDSFMTGAKFAIVVANVDFSGEPLLAGKVPAYVIKTVGAEKIGLFGLALDDLPTATNAGPNIRMKDSTQAAKDMVAELTKQGVNKIVLLSHRGYQADVALAAKVDGIDLIVGGHTHTLLGDPAKLDKTLGAPMGPYPTVIGTPNGGKTLVVQNFEFGRNLGKIDLTFNDKGEVAVFEGHPVFVDKNLADDPDAVKKLDEFAKPLADLKKQIIGKTAVDLDGETRTMRNRESNLGNLVADAMLWSTAYDKTQLAMANGGGIRRSVKAGDISYGDVLEVLPFGNRLVHFDLLGADLVAALENGVSQIYADGSSGGRFPHVAGFKFSADLSKPVGLRVTDVQIGNAKDGYKPLDRNATYRIVTLDFMANGGDGYMIFTKGKNPNGGDVQLDQALTEYIKATNGPVNPKVEGRITLTGTPPAAPTIVPTATPATAASAPTATPTPAAAAAAAPLPTWTPIPIPTFSFEPVLPSLLGGRTRNLRPPQLVAPDRLDRVLRGDMEFSNFIPSTLNSPYNPADPK